MLRISTISSTNTQRFPITRVSFAAIDSGVTTLCTWPGRGASTTDITPFLSCLLHLYTYCCDKHASPYWTFIRRWTSIGFTLSKIKKNQLQNIVLLSCMYVVEQPSWNRHCDGILSALYATYRILLIAFVTCLPTYWTMTRYRIFISVLRVSFNSPT
jgi:hypothetical protein